MSSKTPIPTQVVFQLIVLGAIWGGAFTLIKVLIDDLTPVEMAAGRLTLGALAVAAVLIASRRFRWPARQLLVPIAVVAMLDTLIPYTLVGWSQSRIESGTAAVLISTMPLFTVIFAAGVLRQEGVGPARIAGLAAGFTGVLVLIGGPSALMESSVLGQMAVVIAAVSYAAGALYARTLLPRVDAANFTATKLLIGAILAAAAMVTIGDGAGFNGLDVGNAAALAALGVVSTGLSFVVYFRIVQQVGSVGASTVTYIIPMFALLFGALFLSEAITGGTIAGMVLIVGGVAAVMYAARLERLASRLVHPRRALSAA
jgi:drug/metabolite transporter (DMT)-like permease